MFIDKLSSIVNTCADLIYKSRFMFCLSYIESQSTHFEVCSSI